MAISAQCGYNVRASGQYRNCLAIKAFKYHRNVFPIPRVWQTHRTQNPVLARGCGFKSHVRYKILHEQYVARRSFRDLPVTIKGLEDRLAKLRQDQNALNEHANDPITVGNRAYRFFESGQAASVFSHLSATMDESGLTALANATAMGIAKLSGKELPDSDLEGWNIECKIVSTDI